MIKRLIYTILFLQSIAFSHTSKADDGLFIVDLKNISDYKISLVLIDVDENGNTRYNIGIRHEIRIGENINLELKTNSQFLKFVFATSSEEADKVANAEYGVSLMQKLGEGTIYTIAGWHNYVMDPKAYMGKFDNFRIEDHAKIARQLSILDSLRHMTDAVKGSEDIPRNPNPLIGSLTTLNGLSILGQTAVSLFFKYQSVKQITRVIDVEQIKEIKGKGIRMVIDNIHSSYKLGISLIEHAL